MILLFEQWATTNSVLNSKSSTHFCTLCNCITLENLTLAFGVSGKRANILGGVVVDQGLELEPRLHCSL
jgi:hypothetical protein